MVNKDYDPVCNLQGHGVKGVVSLSVLSLRVEGRKNTRNLFHSLHSPYRFTDRVLFGSHLLSIFYFTEKTI